MIEFTTDNLVADRKFITENNKAFEIQLKGETIPFYNYKDGQYISPISPSGIDNPLDRENSETILKEINKKLQNKKPTHYGLTDYYSSTFIVKEFKNECGNCKYCYLFGTNWDTRCDKIERGRRVHTRNPACIHYKYTNEY